MIKSQIRTLIAFLHWNNEIVCTESKGKYEYHDYKDSIEGEQLTCKRCGKKFSI